MQFFSLGSNFVVGDLGIGDTTSNNAITFAAIHSPNGTVWNTEYHDGPNKPAVGYSFPIISNSNTPTLINMGQYFPIIPSNQTIKSYTTTDYTQFYQDTSSRSLKYNTTSWPNKMYFSGVPFIFTSWSRFWQILNLKALGWCMPLTSST